MSLHPDRARGCGAGQPRRRWDDGARMPSRPLPEDATDPLGRLAPREAGSDPVDASGNVRADPDAALTGGDPQGAAPSDHVDEDVVAAAAPQPATDTDEEQRSTDVSLDDIRSADTPTEDDGFARLGLHAGILGTLAELGYEEPT